MQIMRKPGRTSRSKRLPRLTLRSGRANRTNFNTSRRIPARVIEANRDVRFTPKSGHVQCTRPCLLWAKSGHVWFQTIRAPARSPDKRDYSAPSEGATADFKGGAGRYFAGIIAINSPVAKSIFLTND